MEIKIKGKSVVLCSDDSIVRSIKNLVYEPTVCKINSKVDIHLSLNDDGNRKLYLQAKVYKIIHGKYVYYTEIKSSKFTQGADILSNIRQFEKLCTFSLRVHGYKECISCGKSKKGWDEDIELN